MKHSGRFFVLELQPGCVDVMRPSRRRSHFYPLCLTRPQYLLNQKMENLVSISR